MLGAPNTKYMMDALYCVPGLSVNKIESMPERSSAHGAFFGNIEGSKVVVKPHPNGDKARRELDGTNEFIVRGLNTFVPFGLFAGQIATYFVTSRYEGLTVLGEDFSRLKHNAPTLGSFNLRIERAARAIAWAHSKGVAHGDYRPKNCFEGPRCEVVFGDLENATFGVSATDFRRGFDIYSLGATLATSKYLYNRPPNYRARAINRLIIDNYVSVMQYDNRSHLDAVEFAVFRAAKTGRAEPFGNFVNGRMPHQS